MWNTTATACIPSRPRRANRIECYRLLVTVVDVNVHARHPTHWRIFSVIKKKMIFTSMRTPTGSVGALIVLILWISTTSYDDYNPPNVAPCSTPELFTLAANDTVDFDDFSVACVNVTARAIRCMIPSTDFIAC